MSGYQVILKLLGVKSEYAEIHNHAVVDSHSESAFSLNSKTVKMKLI